MLLWIYVKNTIFISSLWNNDIKDIYIPWDE